jgi:hypothetical protein
MAKHTKITIETDSLLILRSRSSNAHGARDAQRKGT